MQEGEGVFDEIDRLGKRLSLELSCAVTWPGYDKNLFKCIRHGFSVPLFRLRAGDDWHWVGEEHDDFVRGIT